MSTTSERALGIVANGKPARRPIEKFTFAELRAAYPNLDEPVVEGIGRKGETINLIGDSKSNKSWTLYRLLLSVITGRDWLDYYPTSAGKALLVDNELPRSLIAYRIAEVAAAMGIPPDQYEDDLEIWPLRGNLRGIHDLAYELENEPPGKFAITGWDSRYRFPLIGGANENENTATTDFYNVADAIAETSEALHVYIGHTSKGDQGGKKITDVGAGAGSQSRAADSHLILRPHEDEGVVVLDGVVRSFPPPKPLALRWSFPVWTHDHWVDAEKIKGRLPANEERQAERDRDGMGELKFALRSGPATIRELRRQTGMGLGRAERLMDKLELAGEVGSTNINQRGNNCRQYHLIENPEKDVVRE